MSNRLAALLMAIMVCIYNPFRASAQETAYIDITESPQYSLEVLCDLPRSGDLKVDINYRGETPSVAFITPSGIQCGVNRMNWSYSDNHISVSIPNADAGCWYVKTLVDERDRIEIICNSDTVKPNGINGVTLGIIIILFFLTCLILTFIRKRIQNHLDNGGRE